MQQLVGDVRAMAPNLLLVEGPSNAQTLENLPSYPVASGVSNVAYVVHPYGQKSQMEWQERFGTVAQTVPVIANEWGEWEAAKGECYANAGTVVPQFFQYLQSIHVGLGGWSLIPGVLVTDAQFTPTVIGPNYQCIDVDAAAAQGAGALMQTYFETYSGALP
jgi:hypothetical protein